MTSTNLIEDLRLLSPPTPWGWWIAGAAAVFLVAVLGWVLLRRRPGVASANAPEAQPPSWESALAELERLAPWLSPEHSREYAIRSSAILRRYIEVRYTLHAPRLATEEFLAAAQESPALPPQHQAALRQYLQACDLLKFARFQADAGELEALHTAAVRFVLASRPGGSSTTSAEEPA